MKGVIVAISMDGHGMYIKRGDGTHEYVPPSDVKVNGQDLYLFDQATGTLSLSASPEDCAFIAQKTGVGADTPKDVILPDPMGVSEIRFPGVRAVVSIAPSEGGRWLVNRV